MSFPKAKLQRFNDVRDTLPSPAAYSPQLANRNCGSLFSHTERFQEQQRDSSNSDSFSVRSANSSGCFRTPILPKKKKTKNPLENNRSFIQTSLDVEAFQEKIVECNNKDLFISELSEQMEEMKLRISNLQNENELLITEKNKCEGKTERLLKEYYGHLENMTLEVGNVDFPTEKEQFKNVDDLDCLFKSIIKISQLILKKKNSELKDVAANVSALKTAFLLEAKNLRAQYSDGLRTVDADVSKIVTHVKNLEEAVSTNIELEVSQRQQQFAQEKMKLQHEHDMKLLQIEKSHKEAEMQLIEKCKNIESTWQTRLGQQEKEAEDILKECQAISEYNIIQCEVEKNAVMRELSQTTEELRNVKREAEEALRLKHHSDLNYHNMKTECEQKLSDLNLLREQLKQERQNLQQAETDKRMYEVTINKTRETIEALKNRLFDSDKDVEQLKLELENAERSKLKLEAECNRLMEKIESAKTIKEDLELQTESTVRIMQKKIRTVEGDLLKKMDSYKQVTEESIRRMSDQLNKKNADLQEIMEQLRRQQEMSSASKTLIEKAREEIENLEASNKDLKLSLQGKCREKKNLESDLDKQLEMNRSLQTQNEQLKLQSVDLELAKQIKELQEKSDSYYKYCEYYKSKAEDYEKEIEQLSVSIATKQCAGCEELEALMRKYEEVLIENSQLEKKVAEQESLIGPFREQLEAYELEYRELMNRKCNAETEAKAIGLKYAELMGHQNQRQKIKHMIDLKMKNNTLNETNMQLQQKLRAQAKIIEKLKNNSNVGKENKQNTTANNHNVTSSPLRERNLN